VIAFVKKGAVYIPHLNLHPPQTPRATFRVNLVRFDKRDIEFLKDLVQWRSLILFYFSLKAVLEHL
jgi:hypothetical protein